MSTFIEQTMSLRCHQPSKIRDKIGIYLFCDGALPKLFISLDKLNGIRELVYK